MSVATPGPNIIGNGQSPGSNPLTIGSVTFNTSEAPSELPIGVEQMAAVQTLAGGTRVVQTFGPSPDEVTWEGNLFDVFVGTRVTQMRLYAAIGAPVLLSWVKANGTALQNGQASSPGSQVNEKYMVIVKHFLPTFYGQHAKYSITLIICNALNGAYYSASPQSVDSQIAALQTTAISLANTLIQNATGVEQDMADTTEIEETLQQVNSNIDAATPISQNPLSVAGIQQSIQSATQAVTAFLTLQSPGSSSYATALQLNGVLSVISKNVAVGSAPQSIQQQGGNLFTVASQYYGDVSQAFTLARVAGQPSPFLSSALFNNILLPNLQPNPQPNQSTGQ